MHSIASDPGWCRASNDCELAAATIEVVLNEEAIVPLLPSRDAIPLATHVRGALIAPSLQLVRSFYLEPEYFAALPPELHDRLRALTASSWLTMDVATAHYAAIDTLGLAPNAILEMGRQSATRVHGSYVRTIIEQLRVTGDAEPVSLLSRLPSILDRIVLGGTAAVFRVGAREVRVELLGMPFLAYDYLRHGWAGAFQASLELVTRKVHVAEITALRTDTSVAYQIAWI
ncbi:hypothetical protein [Sandaracinus amylolyticus]|uniref:hypothetical protein n=1 Tax=Sandaracinus amylolyticus TaxID=927083 RepID=UPI001F19FB6D|nr:hypothetical protein [Sandaracinus amylolyticus]